MCTLPLLLYELLLSSMSPEVVSCLHFIHANKQKININVIRRSPDKVDKIVIVEIMTTSVFRGETP